MPGFASCSMPPMCLSATTVEWVPGSSLPSSGAGRARAEHAAALDVAALTRAVGRGDTEALARLYREWFDPMYRAARRMTGRDEAFCLDVVQDSMLRVIRSIRPMRTRKDLWCWLRAVVLSCAYDRLRAEARRRRRERVAAEAAMSLTREARGAAEATAALEEQLSRLHRRIAALDDRHAQILVMRHRFGWTLSRIGRHLGLEPGAVDGRLRRIAERLRGGKGHD